MLNVEAWFEKTEDVCGKAVDLRVRGDDAREALQMDSRQEAY